MNINEVIQVFVENHKEELYTKDFESKVVSWLENATNVDTKEILIHLLSEFTFYTKIEIKNVLKRKLDEVFNSYPLEDICIIPMVTKNGRLNSSYDLTMLLKEIVKENDIALYKDTFKMGLYKLDADIKTLVFFDDISGTGGTIVTFLKENKNYLLGRKIDIQLIVITEIANKTIEDYLDSEHELNVKVTAEYKYDKIFIEHDILKDSHKIIIKEFEETIWGKGNQNVMGFKDSQLLIGFSHNIPNNTISSFWYHTDFSGQRKEWNCLFKRYTQLNRNSKKTRSNQNLSIKNQGGGGYNGL